LSYAEAIANTLNIRAPRVQAAIDLLDAGNTIPFIARYRKEATDTLDEEQLRQVADQLEKRRSLDDRRATIVASVEAQGKMTEDLRRQIEQVETSTALEDLYQPYKPKRRTRAMIAKEKGLQGLADLILAQSPGSQKAELVAKPFLNEMVTSIEEALAGARDIIAEAISDHAEVRALTRQKALQWGSLFCEKVQGAEDAKRVYELYYAYECRVDRLRPHQALAINRGEEEKILRVSIIVPERDWMGAIQATFRPERRSMLAEQLQIAIVDSAERLLLPAIERDVRRFLTEAAWKHATGVFGSNLRSLLSQPPLSGRTVLGVDPGFRTGCKLAVVDPTGKVQATGTIYPHEPQKRWKEALEALDSMIKRYGVSLISIGNGTASRETEKFVAELIHSVSDVKYVITSEAGASVYSASPLARAEMPDLDVSLRGAVSIARRVQDALAELVKIDPKAIGVGMYQHDVDQAELARALNGVVESVVNQVGVDINTASPALLTYVAGVGPKLADKLVAYRDEHGAYQSRGELRKVPGLGPKAFEQSAGFLRIHSGRDPLDASAIHPESYPVARAVINLVGLTKGAGDDERRKAVTSLINSAPIDRLAERLGVGAPTLQDILEQLVRPGRDPREELPAPILRSDVLSMEDLAEGMRLKGTVRNAVDFGAFVDIGVKQEGLLHRSQLPPGTAVHPGDVVEVEILKVEPERGRISLRWAGDW
jgi:uncharacterized protein